MLVCNKEKELKKKKMTNWINVQIDIKMTQQAIEDIDCEIARLEVDVYK